MKKLAGLASAAATHACRALEIDPEDAAARRIVGLLTVPTPEPPAEVAQEVAPEQVRRGWFRRLLDRLFGGRH